MSENNVVSRYTTAARINHWITAVSLILLALSGMALFHPSLFFLTHLFGGGQMTRAVHPWIGVVLFFSFLGLFFRFFALNLWNRDDTVWMKNLGAVINDREEGMPELGKYNAGQKLVFWGQSILILLLFGSGLVLWDVYFEAYTYDRPEAAVGGRPCAVRDRRHPDLDRPRLRRDLGQGHLARHDPRLGHPRLELEAPSQVVPPGSRQALSNLPDNTVGAFAESDPVRLPDLVTVFARRAERLAALAPGHELEGFLRMIAALVLAQHDALSGPAAGNVARSDEGRAARSPVLQARRELARGAGAHPRAHRRHWPARGRPAGPHGACRGLGRRSRGAGRPLPARRREARPGRRDGVRGGSLAGRLDAHGRPPRCGRARSGRFRPVPGLRLAAGRRPGGAGRHQVRPSPSALLALRHGLALRADALRALRQHRQDLVPPVRRHVVSQGRVLRGLPGLFEGVLHRERAHAGAAGRRSRARWGSMCWWARRALPAWPIRLSWESWASPTETIDTNVRRCGNARYVQAGYKTRAAHGRGPGCR